MSNLGLWYVQNGQLARRGAPEPTPNALGVVGWIGDSLTYQGGSTDLYSTLVDAGFDAASRVSGVTGRLIWEGSTTPTVKTTIDTWRAGGFDPEHYVIALGANNSNATDTQWDSYIKSLLDYIVAGPRPRYRVSWVGISFAPTYNDIRSARFVAAIAQAAVRRDDLDMTVVDFDALIHDGRDESGLWLGSDSTGRHMTSDGYLLRNELTVAELANPTEHTMLIGAHTTNGEISTFLGIEDSLERTMGIRRSYITGAISGTFSGSIAGVDINKRASLLSFKGDPADMIAGSFDTALTNFLNSVPTNHDLWLTWQHEMENPNKSINSAQFVAGSRRFYQIVKAVRPQTTVVQPIYIGWTFNASSGRDKDDWYPGDDYCDVLGIDAYNSYLMGYAEGSTTWWDSPTAEVRAFAAWARFHGKRLAIAEYGCNEDAGGNTARKAKWIKDYADFVAIMGGGAMTYFHSYKEGDTHPTIVMDSSPATIAVFRDLIDTYQEA